MYSVRMTRSLCRRPVFTVRTNSGALPPLDNEFGRTCNYTAKNVNSDIFFNGLSGREFMFPLEFESNAVRAGDKPWKACFNSSESHNLEAIRAGNKLPCSYTVTTPETVDYWEEHACQESLKSNCYCFAVSRYVGSYCDPGYASGLGNNPQRLGDCDWAVKGVIADGGVQVDRNTVYFKQPIEGHYIALAVWPEVEDYHFWRLESSGSWAHKPGSWMPRRTYGSNNAVIADVEVPDVLGKYRKFCSYFEVFPETHKLKATGRRYTLLERFEQDWLANRKRTIIQHLQGLALGLQGVLASMTHGLGL